MLSFSVTSTPYGVSIFIAFAVLVSLCVAYLFTRPKYPDAPTLRISKRPGWLGTLEDCKLFVTDMPRVVSAGWERYSKNGINYLLNTPSGKLFIIAPQFLEEIRKAPDEYASSMAANSRLLQISHTIHPNLVVDHYHIDVPIRKTLTQNLGKKLPEMVEEAKLGLNNLIKIDKGTGTAEVSGGHLAFNAVTPIANRILFGVDLARNPEFHAFSIGYTGIVFSMANYLRNFPEFMKPLIMRWRTDISSAKETARRFLIPLLEKRMADEDRCDSDGKGDVWRENKPDDVIQWVLDETPPHKREPEMFMHRLLHLNIASTHTTACAFLETLLCLSVLPQYHEELRSEIVEVFRQEGGWSRNGITQLTKLDSFMTEVQRLCVITSLKMGRIAIQPWHLSDGTKIPAGTFFFMNHSALVLDPSYYDDPHRFDPWRMYRKRQEPGEQDLHQFVTASEQNLAFGYGRHACPGRHFSAAVIKLLLVLIIMKYDFQAVNAAGSPLTPEEVIRGVWFNKARMPVMSALFQFMDRTTSIPEDLRMMF